ncbi:hypothetical protein RJ035_004907 [Blastomyces gilchristii]
MVTSVFDLCNRPLVFSPRLPLRRALIENKNHAPQTGRRSASAVLYFASNSARSCFSYNPQPALAYAVRLQRKPEECLPAVLHPAKLSRNSFQAYILSCVQLFVRPKPTHPTGLPLIFHALLHTKPITE